MRSVPCISTPTATAMWRPAGCSRAPWQQRNTMRPVGEGIFPHPASLYCARSVFRCFFSFTVSASSWQQPSDKRTHHPTSPHSLFYCCAHASAPLLHPMKNHVFLGTTPPHTNLDATAPANIMRPVHLLDTKRSVRFRRSSRLAVLTCHNMCAVAAPTPA